MGHAPVVNLPFLLKNKLKLKIVVGKIDVFSCSKIKKINF
jgi:hypothetical protein